MKDRIPKGRIFIAAASMAAASFACAYADTPISSPTPNKPDHTPAPTWTLPFEIVTPESTVSPVPSGTPLPTDTEIPTTVPTETPEKPKPPEIMMPYIGKIYLGNAFDIYLPEETARLAAFWDGDKSFLVKDPFIVIQNELTQEEYDTMNPHNIINTPKVGLVFQTDNRRDGAKHLMVYAHSGYSIFREELPLNFFKKIINMNPESLIGTRFSLIQEDKVSNLEVVHYTIVPEVNFNTSFFNYKNSDDPAWRNVPLFLSFNAMCENGDGTADLCLGIDISKEPFNGDSDLITFVACYGPQGDLTSGRMLITAKLLK